MRNFGAHRIDVNGDEHGELAHIVRSIQKTLGHYEIPHAKRHEQELLAGHFVNFYGRWVMENLEP